MTGKSGKGVLITELKHKSESLKTNILNIVEIGDQIVKFKLPRSPYSEIDTLKTLENELKTYRKAINGVSEERMYRVHYDLYARTFKNNKNSILSTPGENGELNDSWIRKSDVVIKVGSNVGKKTNYQLSLSLIYQKAVDIYKKYHKDKDYVKECSYVDQMMMYLYRIFASFVWGEQSTNKILLNNEKHIRVNMLKITKGGTGGTGGTGGGTSAGGLQNIFSQIPSIIDGISKGFGGDNKSEFGQNFQGFGDVAKKFFNDPNATKLLMNTLGDIQKDIKNGNDLGSVVQSTFSKLSNPKFSNSLKQTIAKIGLEPDGEGKKEIGGGSGEKGESEKGGEDVKKD